MDNDYRKLKNECTYHWFNFGIKKISDEQILYEHDFVRTLFHEIEHGDGFKNRGLINYFTHLKKIKYYENKNRTGAYHSIMKIYLFFRKLKTFYFMNFGDVKSYNSKKKSIKLYETHADFISKRPSRGKRLEIVLEIEKLFTILNTINTSVEELNYDNIAKNSFEELSNELEGVEKIALELNEKYAKSRKLLHNLIEDIIKDSDKNIKNNMYLKNGIKNGNPIEFSNSFNNSKVSALDALPLVEFKFNGLTITRRSVLYAPMHKDKSLNVFHYNLVFDDHGKRRNIHVIPTKYKKEVNKLIA